MTYYRNAFLLSSIVVLASCGGQHSHEETSAPDPAQQTCTYTYNADSSRVIWTAFKTTEKVGVSGTFNEVKVNGTQQAQSVVEAMQSASFVIPVAGVNTTNPDRDKKIMEHFFGTMASTTELTGSVVSLDATTANVAISMNGVTDTVKMDVVITDSKIALSAVIELANWSAQPSVDALNKVCFDLHKGADGVSKLWPEVKLEVSTTLNKACQ